MWLAAATPSPAWQLATTIGGAIVSLIAAVVVGWFSLRGSTRSTDSQRETAFDAQVDADRTQLRAKVEKLEAALDARTAERDDYRERYAALRVGVRNAGLDPDELGRPDAPR